MIPVRRPLAGLCVPPCPQPARVRAPRALVRALRAPTRPPADPVVPQVLRALETAALVLAVGAHISSALAAQRQLQGQQQWQQQQGQGRGSQQVAQAVPPPAAPAPPLLQPAGSFWLTLPLVMALALGHLRSWLMGTESAADARGRRLSNQAAARLVRVESEVGQQAAALAAAARQLDKLAIRSRLVGRDLKLPMQQLQAAAGQQSEALVGLVERMERFEQEMRGTEELVVAMQGVSAKQFQLLLKVVEQQQQGQGPGAPSPSPCGQPIAAPPPPPPPLVLAASAEGMASIGSRPSGFQQPHATSATAPTDEWGRQVVPLPLPASGGTTNSSTTTSTSMGAAGGVAPPAGSLNEAAEALAAAEEADPRPSSAAWDETAAHAAVECTAANTTGANATAGGTSSASGEAPQAGSGLSLESFLGIIAKDAFFKAEQEMIRAMVNQPKPSPKPEIEILPPLVPPPDALLQAQQQAAAEAAEAPSELRRRLQVEEWRQRVSRSWDMAAADTAEATADLEAALAQSSTEQGSEGSGGAAADAADAANGQAELGGGSGKGDAPDAGGGVRREDNDDGSTTFHF